MYLITPKSVPLNEFERKITLDYGLRRKRFTRKRIERVLNACRRIGAKETFDLNLDLVREFLSKRPEGESPNTRYTALGVLQTICNFAVEEGYLNVSPFAIKPLRKWVRKVTPKQPRVHSREEINHLLDQLRAEAVAIPDRPWERWRAWRLYALVATVAYTAMRRDEACRLLVRRVDLGSGLILLCDHDTELKTQDSAQPLPIASELSQILTQWFALCDSLDPNDRPRARPGRTKSRDWCFPNATFTGPWTSGGNGYRPIDALKAAAKRAGLEHPGSYTWQSLRHSWATHAEYWGLTDAEIQRIMRHSNTKTQWHYRHAEKANLRAAVRAVSFAPDEARDAAASGDVAAFAAVLAKAVGLPRVSHEKAAAVIALLKF